jgi:Flp pilus assembly pilin Flp
MKLTMTNLVRRFARDQSGATAIEHGLIAVQGLGTNLKTALGSVQTALK